MKKLLWISVVAAGLSLVAARSGRAAEEPMHAAHEAGETVTVTGEVVDLACYTDHGAMGAKHEKCAAKCIESGLPVGIKATDGKTYLLIGDHKPANKQLATYAAKTVTVTGKLASRDGINMIEDVQIVK